MKNNYFANCATNEEVKKEYRKLAFEFHPDKNGNSEESNEIMKAINDAFEKAFNNVKNIFTNVKGERYTKETTEVAEEFINIVNEVIKMEGVEIDVVGCFLWLVGETTPYKDELKKLGFLWSSNKKMWYKAPKSYKKTSRKQYDYNEITSMFGVKRYAKKEDDMNDKKYLTV